MRKHDVRKWLHAILDLLPVILIPVFMIYSHRHTIDSGSIDVPQNQVVDFNQLVENPNFENNTNIYALEMVEYTISNNDCITVVINDTGEFNYQYSIYRDVPLTSINDIYLIRFKASSNNFTGYATDDMGGYSEYLQSDGFYYWRFTEVSTHQRFYICPLGTKQVGYSYTISDTCVFNLTRMFGSGYEPTIQQFNQWYSAPCYDYTLSHKELLKGTSTITYQDTDIMSQVVYQLYNSVDKYFNMGNVFNMTGVYDWFNLNIFNGNAPISIYIVWNIVLYEFVMDLLFLLYGLFMWFIDMVEKILDKPFKSIK